MQRRTFLGGMVAASIPVAAIAAPPETLDERITRLKDELLSALNECWPTGAESLKASGNCIVFIEKIGTRA